MHKDIEALKGVGNSVGYHGGKTNMHATGYFNTSAIGSEQQLWHVFLDMVKKEYGDEIYHSWFANLAFVGINDGMIEIIAPDKMVRQSILNNYYNKFRQFLVSLFPSIRIIDLKVQDTLKKVANDSTDEVKGSEKKQWKMRLEKRFTFENYISSDSNIMALSAAKAAAGVHGESASVIYIYGSVGLGKTHLLQAIAQYIQHHNVSKKVLYLSAEKFMNHYVQALRNNTAWSFKDQFADIDLLLVDDLQFICGKIGMQKEFNNVFNMLVESGGSVVVAADRSPYNLELDVRTKSRLVGGLAVEIKASDYGLRLMVLTRLIEDMKVRVSKEVLEFLAQNVTSSIRELVGAMQNLIHYAKIENSEITISRAHEILKECILSHEMEVTLEKIMDVVAQYYSITSADIASKSREARFVKSRQITAYIAKQITDKSLKDIGKALGKRDHATIIYSIHKLEDLLVRDKNLKQDINKIMKTLGVNV